MRMKCEWVKMTNEVISQHMMYDLQGKKKYVLISTNLNSHVHCVHQESYQWKIGRFTEIKQSLDISPI